MKRTGKLGGNPGGSSHSCSGFKVQGHETLGAVKADRMLTSEDSSNRSRAGRHDDLGNPGLAKSRMRRTDEGDRFPFVPPIDAEIFAVNCDDAVARVKLAHADETKIG